MHFADRLAVGLRRTRSPLMVGLDPRVGSLPAGLLPVDESPGEIAAAFRQFCCGVIDAVCDVVAVVKPQLAFFEQYGPPGIKALAEVIRHARSKGLLVVLDGKRNDIGSTAEAYAAAYLGAESVWQGDALTVSPYLGDDSLIPFWERARATDSGIFVLVKTSNPGGGFFQDLRTPDAPLYQRVAAHVEDLAAQSVGDCGYGIVGAVVGATYPRQLTELRQQMPHAWLLVPGYGAQGGKAEDLRSAFDDSGYGSIVNSSRGIIFAHDREPYRARFGASRWQDAVAAAANDASEELGAVAGLR
ncbi:MAG: orotidine-5'-phosphate decarboxylase [Pirellulaceae bacterium]